MVCCRGCSTRLRAVIFLLPQPELCHDLQPKQLAVEEVCAKRFNHVSVHRRIRVASDQLRRNLLAYVSCPLALEQILGEVRILFSSRWCRLEHLFIWKTKNNVRNFFQWQHKGVEYSASVRFRCACDHWLYVNLNLDPRRRETLYNTSKPVICIRIPAVSKAVNGATIESSEYSQRDCPLRQKLSYFHTSPIIPCIKDSMPKRSFF
mmetsp:Transcript_15017/g.22110  ORF Transcript_15017/g.22110 Transcript_15017/m.22110 type:complete len:206 (-) Transcript_15017:352-969(-)